MNIHDVLPILQIAVGPVILVSGVGLLLLTMTNRLGRVLDRSREIARTLREDPSSDSERLIPQLAILERRARLVRMAIAFATTSVLFAARSLRAGDPTAALRPETTPARRALAVGRGGSHRVKRRKAAGSDRLAV